jgi:hypothetical protein
MQRADVASARTRKRLNVATAPIVSSNGMARSPSSGISVFVPRFTPFG